MIFFYLSALLSIVAAVRPVCEREFGLVSIFDGVISYSCKGKLTANLTPTRLMYHLENPNGFVISTKVADGAVDCWNKNFSDISAKTESSLLSNEIFG